MAAPPGNTGPDNQNLTEMAPSDLEMMDAPPPPTAVHHFPTDGKPGVDAEGVRILLEAEKMIKAKAQKEEAKKAARAERKALAGIRRAAWLESYPDWKSAHLGPKWIPVKVLGEGGYGIVGLWKWDGDGKPARFPDQVVIKQAADEASLMNEEVFLGTMALSKTKHVVRMYGTVYTEPPTDPAWTIAAGGQKSRIFLEYCDQGSLEGFITQLMERIKPDERIDLSLLTEYEAWVIFLHLTKAITAMEKGNEDASPDSPAWRQLQTNGHTMVHFDFKPGNVLFHGERHDDQRVFKVSDFGLAGWVWDHKLQNPEYVRTLSHRGTRGFRPMEQTIFEGLTDLENAKGFLIGPESNVWNLGMTMLCLLTRCHGFEGSSYEGVYDDAEFIAKYSKNLRDLVRECCDKEWSNRKSPANLRLEILSIIKALQHEIPNLGAEKGKTLEPLYWDDVQDEPTPPAGLSAPQKRSRSPGEEFEESPNKRPTGDNEIGTTAPGLDASQAPGQAELPLIKVLLKGGGYRMASPFATIADLLAIIFPDEEVDQQIEFQGKLLTDQNKTLHQYGIVDGSEVRVISSVELPAGKIQVKVNFGSSPAIPSDLETDVLQLNVHPTDTVWDLAKMIAAQKENKTRVTHRAYAIEISLFGTVLKDTMKTLRSYNIGHNSILEAHQIPRTDMYGLPQGVARPEDYRSVKVGHREFGRQALAVDLWRDVDFEMTLQDFLILVAGELGWRCIRTLHVNKKDRFYLQRSLKQNHAVHGCSIDVEGGKEPVGVIHNIENTDRRKGAFRIYTPLCLDLKLREFVHDVNFNIFHGRYISGIVHSVDGQLLTSDEGGAISQSRNSLVTIGVESGSQVSVTFTEAQVVVSYRYENQELVIVQTHAGLNQRLAQFISLVINRQNLECDRYIVVSTSFHPQVGGINMDKSLRDNGAVAENHIEITLILKMVENLIIQCNDPETPEGADRLIQFTPEPQREKQDLRKLIAETIKSQLPHWTNFRVVAINGQAPAPDIFTHKKTTLGEIDITDGNVIDIEQVQGSPPDPDDQTGDPLPEEHAPEGGGDLTGVQSTVTGITLEYVDANGNIASARTPDDVPILVDTMVSALIWQLVEEFKLEWMTFVLISIDGRPADEDFGLVGKMTLAENNIKDGSVLRIQESDDPVPQAAPPQQEPPQQEPPQQGPPQQGPPQQEPPQQEPPQQEPPQQEPPQQEPPQQEPPQQRPPQAGGIVVPILQPAIAPPPPVPVGTATGVIFRYPEANGATRDTQFNQPLPLNMILHTVIERVVYHQSLNWAGFVIVSINMRLPAPNYNIGVDMRTLGDHGVRDGSVIVIAPK